MILRVWRGYTSPENAAAYEALLTGEIMPAIAARKVPASAACRSPGGWREPRSSSSR